MGLQHVFRHSANCWSLEVPRGFIDKDEDPLVAAMRELNEETGLLVRQENMLSLGVILPEAGVLAARTSLWVALDCNGGGRTDKDEIGLGEFLSWLQYQNQLV